MTTDEKDILLTAEQASDIIYTVMKDLNIEYKKDFCRLFCMPYSTVNHILEGNKPAGTTATLLFLIGKEPKRVMDLLSLA